MTRIKWTFFEVHQLIVIRGKIDEEIVNTTDKQGILFIPSIKLFYKKRRLYEDACALSRLNKMYEVE